MSPWEKQRSEFISSETLTDKGSQGLQFLVVKSILAFIYRNSLDNIFCSRKISRVYPVGVNFKKGSQWEERWFCFENSWKSNLVNNKLSYGKQNISKLVKSWTTLICTIHRNTMIINKFGFRGLSPRQNRNSDTIIYNIGNQFLRIYKLVYLISLHQ